MTATKLAQERVFQRDRCAPVPRITPRVRARAERVLHDYYLFDEQGMLLGTIAAACTGPRLGKMGATLASDWL